MTPSDAGRGPGSGASGAPDDRGGHGSSGLRAGTQTIGGVLAALTPDFPDLTISKIRFLEAEGLITPHRTGSGYRTYTDGDVERLRYVLSAQRDRFWPLKVIRDALDAMDRGLTPGEPDAPDARPRVPPSTSDPDVPTIAQLAAPPTLRMTARELRDAAGLDRPTLEALETYGLVRADAGGHFDDRCAGRGPSRGRPRRVRGRAATPASVPHRRRPGDRPGAADRRSGTVRGGDVRREATAAPRRTPPLRSCACASPCTRPSYGPASANPEPGLTPRGRAK